MKCNYCKAAQLLPGKLVFLAALMAIFVNPRIQANVTLPAVFSDHMVLQQNSKPKLWGWGRPMEKISVTTSWSTDTIKTEVDPRCNWSVQLPTPAAGGPYTITIQGYNRVVLSDVLIGEVWLLAGQSNMEWNARLGFNNAEEEVSKANHPNIRFFTVTHRTANEKQHDVNGQWTACTPETMNDFSAAGYFFARQLQAVLGVPVGLINTSWGGSPIEIWMDEQSIAGNKMLYEASKLIPDMAWSAKEPGVAYNAMIAPLMPYGIAGALWYQGETNAANPGTYDQMLSAMVSSWRKGFNTDFSFYYAQIAPWNGYGGTGGVEVRDAQRRALQLIPNSGMVVVSDIGDTVDIHPRNKLDVGLRFANLALNRTYGLSDKPESGPLFKGFAVNGKKVLVSFDYADGLIARGKALEMFEVQGADGVWHTASAKIKKTVIELRSPVENIQAVRFAWGNTATPGLFNANGLPASCFSSKQTDK